MLNQEPPNEAEANNPVVLHTLLSDLLALAYHRLNQKDHLRFQGTMKWTFGPFFGLSKPSTGFSNPNDTILGMSISKTVRSLCGAVSFCVTKGYVCGDRCYGSLWRAQRHSNRTVLLMSRMSRIMLQNKGSQANVERNNLDRISFAGTWATLRPLSNSSLTLF